MESRDQNALQPAAEPVKLVNRYEIDKVAILKDAGLVADIPRPFSGGHFAYAVAVISTR